ncbi:DNA gyrase subunit A [Thermoclostridium stercorarium subsp. stercorarium DSM 8532]|uniref:DNA gyrase subunit A n=2 Tax=Thermoclostridium stercorarium TaxID=1510 RepID=L7VS14_THES1|nr:DNA gyrase subunit A [Thermoclostridium stercorarium]AGC69444.1 DNA gyrase subunit A [Thermoclostridium stercorarium subsp. stercorarium DSM 8532]AGI40404.1 topoisomerase A subunit [Thermoclostridium stercorarium subsp. stercorarium DSM 8532]ANW99692.1 topoisomerase IV [Thermoclostridium stercorarium subsp. thermolacticum DSM 2910]
MKFTEQKIVETLKLNYMPYAMSVIVSRAIPEIDGLKPSHRKLLYTMYKMGLLNGDKTKSANVVGQTMKLNPHGDMAIYETMVRLTTGYGALLHPLIESKGNFGRVYSRDMKYAAPRYTEVKLAPISAELFRDIDKDTVDFTDNYDGTMKEPVLLPTVFPNILVNPNQGIAVGMASNICSFNLKEVCEATIAYIKNDNVDLLQYLKAPDFPTGGELIYNERELRNIYETGRGSFRVRARYRFDKKNNCIEIYEIPYTTTAETIIDSITELVKNGKIKDITDVRDETDLSGLKITIDIKRSADPDALMNKLFKLTPLEDSFGCNFNILINGRPQVLGIKGILDNWIEFRMNCIRRQTAFDIKRKSERLHLLEGLSRILLDIDKAIKIIRETEKEDQVVPNLMKGFGIDQTQAEFIAEIKLRNLNREYILKQTANIEALKAEIAELKDIYEKESRILDIICRQLEEISKKYGQPRRTGIISEQQVEVVTEEVMIEDYNVRLFLTEQGYLKKIPLTSLRSSGEQKLKEDDRIIQEIEARNKSDLILFSSQYVAYKIKVHEINDCKTSMLGEYLGNVLELNEGERILYMVATEDYSGYMLFSFVNGKCAKIPLSSYATKTNRKKLINAYSNESPLCDIRFLREDRELVAFSDINKVLIFNTANINPKATRDSGGVQVMKSKNGSIMVKIKELDEVNFTDFDYYRTKNIPAVGCYLKDEDREEKQVKMF